MEEPKLLHHLMKKKNPGGVQGETAQLNPNTGELFQHYTQFSDKHK